MKFKTINQILLLWILEAQNLEVSSEKIDFAVGGQAVIEGVMMRAPNNITIAVRKLDGSIKIHQREHQPLTQRIKSLNVIVIRGMINLFEMMGIGAKAINYSANESLEEPEDIENPSAKTTSQKILEIGTFIFSLVFAIGFSLLLFKGIPLLTATYFNNMSDAIANNYILFNLIDGVTKLIVFLSYILILSWIPSFRRIFEYHGAEHKAIFTYENHLPLDTKHAKPQSRFHPRCGTSFILIVFIFSIVVYTFIPKQDSFWLNLVFRIAALPLIAGISYEYLKLSAKHVGNPFVKALVTPGLWLQKITTKEPDDPQLEVGLKSLEESLEMEENLQKGRQEVS